MINIINYEDKYHADFKRLNMIWLEEHNLLEQHDIDVLDNPRHYILDDGGALFLAKHGDEIVGTGALAKMEDGVYELVKMSVSPSMRGAGIGKMLLLHCVNKARELGVKQLILYSSSKLQAAVKMYEKYGFTHIPLIDSPFVTADVKMMMEL